MLSKSSAKAEYMAMNTVTCKIAANPMLHERTKHFEIELFFLREKVAAGIVKTMKVNCACLPLFDYEERVLSSGGRGRGVKEKDTHVMVVVNTIKANDTSTVHGGTSSVTKSGYGRNCDGNVNGKEGLKSSFNVVNNSIVNKDGVANVNVTFSTDDKLHDENIGQTPSNSTANPTKGTSYANLFTFESNRKSVAYSVVANYVRNTWGKYGLVELMLNSSTGLFHFQFSSMDGLNSMLENGLWFVRNNPLIPNKWNPDVNLLKEDVNVPVWVKLHGVLVMAFNEDGLSVIATKLGTPSMLDLFTPDMSMQSLGRSSYARAMSELRADVELKDTIVVAMPKLFGEGFYTCNVQYEWKPPKCACCKVFGHVQDECPRNIGSDVVKNLKKPNQAPRGVPLDPKVVSSSDYDSKDEGASVDNEMASFLASKKVGYGTNNLLEQWKETYENADYDYDPYDEDLYEGQ
ncbi:copia protein, partial [Tanacetum coccineum]